jgi:hypothetical protein
MGVVEEEEVLMELHYTQEHQPQVVHREYTPVAQEVQEVRMVIHRLQVQQVQVEQDMVQVMVVEVVGCQPLRQYPVVVVEMGVHQEEVAVEVVEVVIIVVLLP